MDRRESTQHTFSPTLEKHPDDKDLQTGHGNNHQTLQQRKVEDSALGAPDGAEVAVLPGAEVLLLACDGAELATELQDALLELGDLFGGASLLGGDGGVADFVLDGDFKVDELVGKGADRVVEAEAVFARFLSCEDVVALAFLAAV